MLRTASSVTAAPPPLTTRMALLNVSATNTEPAASAAKPLAKLTVAAVSRPSTLKSKAMGSPSSVVTAPAGVTRRSLLVSESASSRSPFASAVSPIGEAKRVRGVGGGSSYKP
jgi:hypothetical protein